MKALLKQRLALWLLISLLLHIGILWGIGIALPDLAKKLHTHLQPLEVVLVNSRSSHQPLNADLFAQNNLDGGGNTAEDRHAQSPLPTLSDDAEFSPEQSTQHLQELEAQAKRLLTQLHSTTAVPKEQVVQPIPNPELNGTDLVQRSLEIARLEAAISKNMDVYQKLPKRKFIGARTQEYLYAQYIEAWRSKIERVGNLNYPQQARDQKLYGKLTLTVSIRADGSVENVEINRSSGQRILDAAAVRIVKLAAPYSEFSADMRKQTDILSITRTWMFTNNDQLESE